MLQSSINNPVIVGWPGAIKMMENDDMWREWYAKFCRLRKLSKKINAI